MLSVEKLFIFSLSLPIQNNVVRILFCHTTHFRRANLRSITLYAIIFQIKIFFKLKSMKVDILTTSTTQSIILAISLWNCKSDNTKITATLPTKDKELYVLYGSKINRRNILAIFNPSPLNTQSRPCGVSTLCTVRSQRANKLSIRKAIKKLTSLFFTEDYSILVETLPNY